MNTLKLFKAAQLIQDTHPDLSEEIVRIAQALPEIADAGTMADPTPITSEQNTNIKNFATEPEGKPMMIEQTFSFKITAPRNMSKTQIMTGIIEKLEEFSQVNDIELSNYEFTQNTK